MSRWLLQRLKRKHNALWVSLVYMTPMGAPTWCVWVYDTASAHRDTELARSSSRWLAMIRAQYVPSTREN